MIKCCVNKRNNHSQIKSTMTMKNLNEFKMVKKNPKDYTIEKFETEFGIMPFPEKSYRQLEKNEITKELKEKRQDYQKCKSFFFEKNNQFHFKMKMRNTDNHF